jgi:bacteriorhodopsin
MINSAWLLQHPAVVLRVRVVLYGPCAFQGVTLFVYCLCQEHFIICWALSQSPGHTDMKWSRYTISIARM